MKCVVYELDSSQVFLPLCYALVVVRLNVLFFFLSTNPSPALILREESPLICYLTVGSKQVHKQKENSFADQALLTKKSSGSGYVLEIARLPLVFFQAMISNLRHQKSVKKVKKVQESKDKDIIFLVGGPTGEDCLPYLTDGSQKSRPSLIDHEP